MCEFWGRSSWQEAPGPENICRRLQHLHTHTHWKYTVLMHAIAATSARNGITHTFNTRQQPNPQEKKPRNTIGQTHADQFNPADATAAKPVGLSP